MGELKSIVRHRHTRIGRFLIRVSLMLFSNHSDTAELRASVRIRRFFIGVCTLYHRVNYICFADRRLPGAAGAMAGRRGRPDLLALGRPIIVLKIL